MKREWPQRRLAEVILDIKDGGTPSRKHPEYFGGDVYWCVVKDIKSLIFDTAEKLTQEGLRNCSAKVWPVDSVIISLGATIGQIGIAKVPTATKQGIAGIVLNKQMMTPEFLAYGLRDQKEYIQSLATGATIKEIRPSRFAEAIRVPVPPLAEQQRIVALLDEAFAALTTAQANAAKNLQNARTLFESHRHAAFAQRGTEWTVKTVDQISTNLDSRRVPITKSDRKSGQYPYYGASGIVDHVADYIFEGDSLLVSEDGANLLMRSTPIAFSVTGRYWVNNHAHILKFQSMYTQRYVEHYLESIQLDQYVTGAAQPKLTQKALNSIPIPLPETLEKQAAIIKSIEDLLLEVQRLESIYEQKVDALEALGKSLLHEALAGQL